MAELFRLLLEIVFETYLKAIFGGMRDLTPARGRRVFAWLFLGALALFSLIFRKEIATIFVERELWIEVLIGACLLFTVWGGWRLMRQSDLNSSGPDLEEPRHSLLRRDQISEPWRAQVEPTRRLIRDESLERAIAALREAGLSIIGSIRVLAELGYPLGEAKRLVHLSEAWAFARDANERFHAEVERAAMELPDPTEDRRSIK